MTLLSEITPKKVVDWTSYSGLTLHRECPQAWSYRHLFDLRTPTNGDDPKVELNFGNWWHALRAADSIERGRALGSLLYCPKDVGGPDGWEKIYTHEVDVDPDTKKVTERRDADGNKIPVTNLVERVFESCEAWEERLPDEHIEQWKSRLRGTPSKHLRRLNDRYLAKWAEERKHEEPVGVEVKWTRELPGTTTVLLGFTDEIFRDTKRGLLVVRDHKTSKGLNSQTTADDMMNSQLHLNAWGLKDRLTEWGIGGINAVAYDRVNSVAPTRPKLTLAGKLSKQVTQFDLETYLEFANSEECVEKGYEIDQALVEKITTPAWISQWFQHTLTPINRNIMVAHLQAAVDSHSDSTKTIQRVQKRGDAPRNFSGSNCRWCDYAKLCRAQMLGGAEGEYDIEEYGLRNRAADKREEQRKSLVGG